MPPAGDAPVLLLRWRRGNWPGRRAARMAEVTRGFVKTLVALIARPHATFSTPAKSTPSDIPWLRKGANALGDAT
jgi:hypothetical protein